MLKYYFNCTTKDNAELFKGLKIMEQEEKYTSKMGYYPVIYITLKDIGLNDEQIERCHNLSNYSTFIAAGNTDR